MSKKNIVVDIPIQSDSQDLLNRGKLVDSLSNIITNWDNDESLIIAICGEWGSGKTSLKNLIINRLASRNVEYVNFDFNPWHWSGNENIQVSFFRELDLKLKETNIYQDINKTKALKRYVSLLGVSDIFTEVIKIPTVVIAMVGIFGWFTGASMTTIKTNNIYIEFMVIFLTSVIIISLITFIARLIINNILQFKKIKEEEISLEDAKYKLAEYLKNSNKKIIITCDDIDRLQHQELANLFQIIKVNADFPNVIYLCFFQKDTVEEILQHGKITHSPKEYLEKIFPVMVTVPDPWRGDIENYFIKEVKNAFNFSKVAIHMDEDVLSLVFRHVIVHYLKNLRSIKRYINTLHFYATNFQNGSTFEVNPYDLIILELIRLYEDKVYKILVKKGSVFRYDINTRDIKERVEEVIIECINNSENKERVKNAFLHLFPLYHSIIEDKIEGSEKNRIPTIANDDESDLFIEKRLCHPFIYHRYFLLDVVPGEINYGDIEYFMETLKDKKTGHDKIVDSIKQDQLFHYLYLLNNYADKISFVSMKTVIESSIPYSKKLDWEFQKQLVDSILRIVNIQLDNCDYGEVLEIFEYISKLEVEYVYFMAKFTDYIELKEVYLYDTYIDAMRKIIDSTLIYIKKFANEDILLVMNEASYFMYFWSRYSKDDEHEMYFNGILADRDKIFVFMKAFVKKSILNGKTYLIPSHPYLEFIVTSQEIFDAASAFSDFTEEEQKILAVYKPKDQ